MFADLLKKALYVSGLLGAYHRLRNARTLTVVMFHRVLEPVDPRWDSCDPDYTLTAEVFTRSLRFFVEHYSIVSVEDVLAARRGEHRLPARAMLITFDDGWADNVDFALPQLRELGLPGLMFVVSDAVDRTQCFYQERIVGAWRQRTLTQDRLIDSLHQCGVSVAPAAADDLTHLRHLIKLVEQLPDDVRTRLLETLAPQLADGLRHMVTTEDLRRLDEGGVTIGLHGKTHTPMTLAADLTAELAGARSEMTARMPYRQPPSTMSFPHGRFDASIAARSLQSGYELVFTSVPAINPATASVGSILGRIGFETDAVTDIGGRFLPERLALYLFRKPHRVLG